MTPFRMSIEKVEDCSLATATWNYWDLEHSPFIHSGFEKSQVLYDCPEATVLWVEIRLPFLRFLKSGGMHVLVRASEHEFIAFSKFFGAASRTTYTLSPAENGRTRYRIEYLIDLNGWRRLLRPLLPGLLRRWNDRVWDEDVPLRRRREMVMRWGFKDFSGLPERLEDRRRDRTPPVKIPLARAGGSPTNAHPLRRPATAGGPPPAAALPGRA